MTSMVRFERVWRERAAEAVLIRSGARGLERPLKGITTERRLMAASRPLVFDRKAVAPGARSLRKGDFLERDHVASIVGSMRAPGWLITMPDWAVKNSRKG